MAEDELKFQQRWEFRRKEDELDSSSDELKSSSNGEPILKKNNLVPGLMISLDNDETSDPNKLEQNIISYNPDFEAQTEIAQAKKEKKTKRRRKNNVAKSVKKRDSGEVVVNRKKKKSKTSAYDNTAAMDNVKNFADSLLEGLKNTRENLFVKMRADMKKLVADIAPKRRRRKGTPGGKKLQLQQHDQNNNLEENIQAQDVNNNNNGAIVEVQQKNGFEEDSQVQQQQNQDNTQVHHQGKFKSSTRARKSNGGGSTTMGRFAKGKKAADDGQENGLYTPTEKEKGESVTLNVNSNVQSGSSNQNAQFRQPKSVVLAIRAQNSKDKSSEKSAKGKKVSDSNKRSGFSQQAIGSMASTEKDTAEGLRLSAEQSFSPISSNQVASSSMYLTLPTVLAAAATTTTTTTPHDSNNRLETSLCNYIQPRRNQMLDPSTHYGYLTSIQQQLADERNGSFAQLGSRITTCFDQNNTIPTSNTGIPLHHQSMDGGYIIPNQYCLQNLPRGDNINNALGLRMNGGAITFSGGGYTLSSDHHHHHHHFVGNNNNNSNNNNNNLQSHSNHNNKADGRLMQYRIPTVQDSSYLYPK
ncbi:hypothetical protein EZV62_023053 [Acer yangbiense]|uniref:Uncharacterized protein n=1 Tax=Acer yangbiense TaxID=1000413 RepID=A0A5C7H122_9ROSI|nr:hypothetical protein EZV62_023053 [Acer yangbiense]